MLCPNCGSPLAEGSRYCPFCGSSLEEPVQRPEPGAPEPAASQELPEPVPESADPAQEKLAVPPREESADPRNDPRGMKWYKFIIYVQLFANALLNAYNAYLYVTGELYGENKALIFSVYPSLKNLGLICGLCFAALAVFALLARQRLAHFRANGPAFYYLVIVANILLPIACLVATSTATGLALGDLVSSDMFTSFAVSLALLIVNMIYFGKRKDLFVN